MALEGLYAGAVTATKIQLPESEIPTRWYNIASDMPNRPQPVLHPGTGEPVGPDDLAPLFPMELILQEVSDAPEIPIPEPVREILRLWRPTPLIRAHRLERALGTRSRIFYKYEGVSPAGSHKPNTAVAQAYYSKQEGRERLATGTGAGQWGSALALACRLRRHPGGSTPVRCRRHECERLLASVSGITHVWGSRRFPSRPHGSHTPGRADQTRVGNHFETEPPGV